MTATTNQTKRIVSPTEAKEILARLTAVPTLPGLMDALVAFDAVSNPLGQNIGVRWVLDNLDAFVTLTRWDVAGFVEDNIGNTQLHRLMSSPDFLRRIVIPSDRERVVREYYLRHGAWNVCWVALMLEAGLTRSELAKIIIARLRVCAAAPAGDKLRHELEQFMSDSAWGQMRQIGSQAEAPGHWRFDHPGSFWDAFEDDEDFAEAIRVCIGYSPSLVLGAWFEISVRLYANRPLLATLRKELLAAIRTVTPKAVQALCGFTIAERRQVIGQLTPIQPPVNMRERMWWQVSDSTFELLLFTVYEAGWSDESKQLFTSSAHLFTALDPVLLVRTFNRFVRELPETAATMLLTAWLKPTIFGWLEREGYVSGTVITEQNHGVQKTCVRVDRVRYVPARETAPASLPSVGATVAFKPHEGRKLNNAGSIVAVLMYTL